MSIKKQIKKMWLKTYNKVLFTKVKMPGAAKCSNMVLNPQYSAEKADAVVAEFKSRFK